MTWRWNRALRRKLREDIRRRLDAGDDPFRWSDANDDDDPEVEPKPGIIDRTWYWLFGSAGMEATPLELEKTLLTYIRAKKGLITNADIMALTGAAYEAADRIGTRLCAAYGGQLEITDEGIPVYRFQDLLLSAAPEVAEQIPRLSYLWQSRRHEHELRHHPSVIIPALNAFNLVFSVVMYVHFLPAMGWTALPAVTVFAAVPFVFSLLFFPLGGIRMAREAAGRDRYEADNMRIAIYRLFFSRRRAVAVPGDERAIGDAQLGWWRDTVVAAHAPEIARAIRGEVSQLPDGRTQISASRILRELDTVERLRDAQGAHLVPVGQTVFSSAWDDDEPSSTTSERAAEIASQGA